MKHIVLLGGGSGISNLIRAFTCIPDWSISALVATSDSGGSTGVIRDAYNIPAIGDIVKNLAALDSEKTSWMTYRHQQGFLAGHTTGNLWLLGLIKSYGMTSGMKKAHELLGYNKHTIIPTTESIHDIEIKTTNKIITGEGKIIQSKKISNKVKSVRLLPEAVASGGAIDALIKADMIIIGPGTLYTSIIASLLPIGIKETISKSKAKKIFIANAANFPRGHCDGYTLDTHLQELSRLTGVGDFTAILAHDGSGIPSEEQILVNERNNITCMNCLDTPDTMIGGKFDSIKRNTLRHDGKKVAQWIKKIFD